MNRLIKWLLRIITGTIAFFLILASLATLSPSMEEYDCEGYHDMPTTYLYLITTIFIGLFVGVWWKTKKREP